MTDDENGAFRSIEPEAKRACFQEEQRVHIQEMEAEPTIEEHEMINKTKHAKKAAYVLGYSVTVQRFDKEKASSSKGSAKLRKFSQQLFFNLAKEIKILQQRIGDGDSSINTENRRNAAERVLSKW